MMPIWVLLTVIAQLMNAVVSLLDRYLVVSEKVGRPIVLAFYTALLSVFSLSAFLLDFLPWKFESVTVPSFASITWPTVPVVMYAISSSVVFVIALVALYESFRKAQASDVVPVVSSITSVATMILSFYILDTDLTQYFVWGVLFLAFGTVLVTHFRMSPRLLMLTLVSGMCFALHFVLLKVLFLETTFDNGFFWSRIAITLVAVAMLWLPNCCQQTVATGAKRAGFLGLILFTFNKILAGIAGILILKAVELGDVTIVQSLTALQFFFLVIFAICFGHKASTCIGEHCEARDRLQKIISVSIIGAGFVLLFI